MVGVRFRGDVCVGHSALAPAISEILGPHLVLGRREGWGAVAGDGSVDNSSVGTGMVNVHLGIKRACANLERSKMKR